MPPRVKKGVRTPRRAARARAPLGNDQEVAAIVASLKRLGSQRLRNEMSSRYGIRLPDPKKAFGVPMNAIQRIAKQVGRNHELAQQLWDTGWYEARLLAAFVDEPERVTGTQMDRWCRDFDNWGTCDTICFKLFDRVTPALAFAKVKKWSTQRGEFQKRAAFALLACLALHDDATDDKPFARCLALIEKAATDDRNFVKKGVSWALRAIGGRSPSLRAAATALAERLVASPAASARWIGADALKALHKPC